MNSSMNNIKNEITELCKLEKSKYDDYILNKIYERLKIIMKDYYGWRDGMTLYQLVNLKIKLNIINRENLINNLIILSLYCNILGKSHNIDYNTKKNINSEKDISGLTLSFTQYNINLYNKYIYYARKQIKPYAIFYFKIAFFVIFNLYNDYIQNKKTENIIKICQYTKIAINIFEIRPGRRINISESDINNLRKTCSNL